MINFVDFNFSVYEIHLPGSQQMSEYQTHINMFFHLEHEWQTPMQILPLFPNNNCRLFNRRVSVMKYVEDLYGSSDDNWLTGT